MNAQAIPHLGPLEVSPALEEGTSMPLSTHWIPLDELIVHWTETDTLLTPAPVAPVLAAIGHALLALARETRALRLYTQAWDRRRWNAPTAETAGLGILAVRHLHEAAHHWSRAAASLDSLLPIDLDPAALERARRLSRIARTQQVRLWALTEEVLADKAAADLQDQRNEEQA
jgi:hypothetical protein